MKDNKKLILKIIHYVSIGIVLLGSILVLISFNKDFIFYNLKGTISPEGFIEEAQFSGILTILLWISVFFPFSNAILHLVTTSPRIIRNNILSWIFSPLVALFGFLQMTVSIFVGLVVILGGLANKTPSNQLIGILLISLSILIFGFFGMWKKPHKNRTSTNHLIINNSRTSIMSFIYLFFIYLLLSDVALSGFILLIWAFFMCSIGSIGEFITDELLNPPKKIEKDYLE